MEPVKKNRNYQQQQYQQPQSQPHQQPQLQPQSQQQQQQQQQQHGRMKGAARILSSEMQSVDQEHQLCKQPEPSAMDTTVYTSQIDSSSQAQIHASALAIKLERCNNNNNPVINNANNVLHHQTNTTTKNLLYMSGGRPEINPSSSSYNIQSNSSVINTKPLAPQPMMSAPATTSTTSATAVTANVMANHQNHNNQQQSLQYDSPQIQPYDIKSLFECPICFDYAVPPIYQCQNGHLVCQSCSNKIAHCPTCRVPISEPSIRNLQLDKLATQFQYPCKYNFVGCQWKSYWFKKREHEEVCDFISYSCPCPGTSCKWTGLLSHVMPHLSEHHKSITTLSGEDIVFLATDINLKGAVDWVMIQSCFNHHFLLVLEKQELKNNQQQFFAIVQLIGTPKEAEKFKYKLELSNNVPGQTKRLQWEATPRSILDGIQFAIANYDCLVFDSRMAQHFLSPIKRDNNSQDSCAGDNNNGTGGSHSENLGINVTIERII